MLYIIYKITNQINGMFYIGSHKTNNVNDSYMGSGTYLKRAIQKYGIENFNKEILFVFDTAGEMYAKEAELVNEEFVSSAHTYNLKIGGFGGWDFVNDSDKFDHPAHNREHMKMMSAAGKDARHKKLSELRKDPVWKQKFSEKVSKAQIANVSKEGYKNSFKGKTHTEDVKRRIGDAAKIHQAGEKNSQYGKPKPKEQIDKMKATIANKPIVSCPHCGKTSKNKSIMMRWHFDNCKNKK